MAIIAKRLQSEHLIMQQLLHCVSNGYMCLSHFNCCIGYYHLEGCGGKTRWLMGFTERKEQPIVQMIHREMPMEKKRKREKDKQNGSRLG